MRTGIALACVSSIFLAAAACSSSSGSSGPEDASGDVEQVDGTASGDDGNSSASAEAGAHADATVSESRDATADGSDATASESDAGPDGGDAAGGGNPYYDGSPGPCGAWTSISVSASQAHVGETLTLSATAAGATPDNLGYTWTQSTTDGGTIGAMGAPSDEAVGPSDVMTFLCMSPGTATIALTVDDAQDGGSCDPHLTTTSTTVTCVASPTDEVQAAWVELGSTGSSTTDGGSTVGTNKVIARVITGAASCPTITLNGGSAQAMNLRVAAGTAALRPTTSTSLGAQYSKPSAFPVQTCELTLPSGTTSAVIDAALPGGSQGITLPLPKANAQTIVVIGDTGCRTQYGTGGTSQWQACNDPTEYAFGTIAATAAALHPDLVIHVGDYEYRDNECPPDIAGCAGRPWGYGWDAWQDDFFAPAKPLLEAAPWIVNRGNHESCTRAGQGWFRFLDTNGYDSVPNDDCNVQGAAVAAGAGGGFVGDNIGSYNTPYAVEVRADTQVIVFDSNNVAKSAITSTGANSNMYDAYQTELLQVGGLTQPNMFNIWTNHHPLLGLAAGTPPASPGIALLSVMQNVYPNTLFPPGINMVLEGHTHLFEALDFAPTSTDAGVANDYPSTFVSGNAGDILDTDLPTPLPDGSTPAPGALEPPQIDNIAHSPNFGFLVMQYQPGDAANGATWLLTEYKTDGTTMRTQCQAKMDGHASCNNWGELP
jgi:hypothetical protein